MDKYIPLINKNNIIKEYTDNDSQIIIPKLLFNNEKIELNKTAKFIYDSINGERCIKEIISLFYQRYKVISLEVVQEDVEQVLFMLWRFGIVGWVDNKNPYKYQYFKSFGEHTIEFTLLETVSEFLVQSSKCEYEYCNPYRYRKNIIQRSFLEQAIVNNFAYSFIIRKQEEIVFLGIVSFDYQDFALTLDYLAVTKIELAKEIDNKKMSLFLSWIENRITHKNAGFSKKRNKAINWLILLEHNNQLFNQYLDNMNPDKRFLLTDETIDGDTVMYLFRRKVS
ncbi:PqqD family protein [Thermoanaerobacterium sp. RBIITD]|uniref:PqqD family protein n=1 Tax=Thermoanaerobacterium sp. RBIITD TaxID=1550240 RepID=UPI000BC071FA|nr:PqqD family protein [Thermoanaerobacterium sp. RBIITD]SNX55024.1 Coenzyme PQQ synthesis protein D (PqqD) [Thermoanaerobacterium sp. RBIITD]